MSCSLSGAASSWSVWSDGYHRASRTHRRGRVRQARGLAMMNGLSGSPAGEDSLNLFDYARYIVFGELVVLTVGSAVPDVS
jgi:hypothetical protein